MHQDTALYNVDSPALRTFIDEVHRIADAEPDRAQTVQLLRPAFTQLMDDQDWLPDQYAQPDPEGGMGEGVGVYLLYRSPMRDLTLMTLVLPAGASTPVHDHLAWGLVGLYQGEQEEWVYRRTDRGEDGETADLAEVERRHLDAGSFYELLPPDGDIHKVQTLGDQPSVSLHLLGSDIGCTWRHRFEPHEHRVYAFRSGYSNEACPED